MFIRWTLSAVTALSPRTGSPLAESLWRPTEGVNPALSPSLERDSRFAWARRRRAKTPDGFTLLEVLVTLALLALAASVVLPGLSSGLNSAGRHAARLTLEGRVLELRRQAMNEGQPYSLGVASSAAIAPGSLQADLELPPGWTYSVEPAIAFYPDGTCSAGVITLTGEAGRGGGSYTIGPPQCRPQK